VKFPLRGATRVDGAPANPGDPPPLPREIGAALLGLTLFAALPLGSLLSPWISGFFLVAITLRLADLLRGRHKASRLLLLPLTLAGLLLVFSQHHTIFGRDAGVSLLTVMLALKLLEGGSLRDVYVIGLLGLFLIVTQFLFYQDPEIVAYLLLLTIGYLGVLLAINRAAPPWWRTAVVESAWLVAQAVPVAVVLFVLFPRLAGPLWGFYTPSGATTGFSEHLSPGSVSQLSLSDAIAFRVDFLSDPPPPRQLYWRGQVFWLTDGREWRTPERPVSRTPPPGLPGDRPPVRYAVTLEAHGKRWMFALDWPVDVPGGAVIREDFQLLAERPVNERRRYTLSSDPDYETAGLGGEERQWGLQLPPNVTPRMRELVAGWLRQAQSPRQVVDAALRHFREEEFVYTLRPPRLERNPSDEFLFETRRGFCEHYATSFTVLMRLAGIPSRVVAGYQGGERNPLGDYWIVRQSDAHAWAEVWLAGVGWVRVDPTAAVAPERIERGLDPARLEASGFDAIFRGGDLGWLGTALRQAGWMADAIRLGWIRWVVNYDTERQNDLLGRLGLGFIRDRGLGLAMVLIAGTLIGGLTLLLLRWDRPPVDPLQRLYTRFCRRLERRGLRRHPHEGPLAFARRVIRRRPDLRGQIEPIVDLYVTLRYGPGADGTVRSRLRRLRWLLVRFRP
jgi:protein-glutamine gamma-glutamyltransferase